MDFSGIYLNGKNKGKNEDRDLHAAIEFQKGRTLREIGDEIGVTHERVRQIHGTTLRRIFYMLNHLNRIKLSEEEKRAIYAHKRHPKMLDILEKYKQFLDKTK